MLFIQLTKQDYYNNFDHRKVPNNNHFGNYIKPLFPNKSCNFDRITLVENDFLILENNDDIVETFNDFFTSVVQKLNILCYQDPFYS